MKTYEKQSRTTTNRTRQSVLILIVRVIISNGLIHASEPISRNPVDTQPYEYRKALLESYIIFI